MIKFVGKRGDTLIEVMLAVGIFSMVAVAVVAVMNSGTSSAQTALETTLTREEIDAQAEALRFIQSAYIADKNAGSSGKYTELWKAITGRDIDIVKMNEDDAKAILNYSPSSCSGLYDGKVGSNGFVINTQKLGNFENVGDVLISYSSDVFKEAVTYPHLTFNSGDRLIDPKGNELNDAQGIYILAVKDPNSTTIMGGDSDTMSAYYDFYIRTCWYGSGDQTSSNISTVIRLYDPDAIKEITPVGEYKIYFNYPNKSEEGSFFSNFKKINLLSASTVERYNLIGWRCAKNPDLEWRKDENGDIVAEVDDLVTCASGKTISLESIGEWDRITINYLLEEGSSYFKTTEFGKNDTTVMLTSDTPAERTGFEFKGWNCEPNKDSGWTGNVSAVDLKNCDIDHFNDYGTVDLYAAWESKSAPTSVKKKYMVTFVTKRAFLKANPEIWVYRNGTSSKYSNLSCSRQTLSLQYVCGKTIVYELAQEDTAYFAVNLKPNGYNFLGLTGSMSITVKENNANLGSFNYNSSSASTNKWWNVFKIQNWGITSRNTYSNGSSPTINY